MEHKLILGGEQYLPFARSRIKALRATGLLYAGQQFEMGDASVKVRIAGEHAYIRIEGGGDTFRMDSGAVAITFFGERAPMRSFPGYLFDCGPAVTYHAGFTPALTGLGRTKKSKGSEGQFAGNLTKTSKEFKGRIVFDKDMAAAFPSPILGVSIPANCLSPAWESSIDPVTGVATKTPVGLTVEEGSFGDENLYLKKLIMAKCPASIFTGKTRLYVQAMYGLPLYEYSSLKDGGERKSPPKLNNPVMSIGQFGGAAPFIKIRPYVAKDDFKINDAGERTKELNEYPDVLLTTHHGVHLSPTTGNHYLINVSGGLARTDVTITPLIGPKRIEALRKNLITEGKLVPINPLNKEDRDHLEAYVLARCLPDVKNTASFLPMGPSGNFSMGYSWHWNWSGTKADIVINETKRFDWSLTKYHMQSAHFRVEVIVDPEELLKSKAELITVTELTDWYVERAWFPIVEPDYSVDFLFKMTPRGTWAIDGTKSPFYAFYRGDVLVVCTIENKYYPVKQIRTMSPFYSRGLNYGDDVDNAVVDGEMGWLTDNSRTEYRTTTFTAGGLSTGELILSRVDTKREYRASCTDLNVEQGPRYGSQANFYGTYHYTGGQFTIPSYEPVTLQDGYYTNFSWYKEYWDATDYYTSQAEIVVPFFDSQAMYLDWWTEKTSHFSGYYKRENQSGNLFFAGWTSRAYYLAFQTNERFGPFDTKIRSGMRNFESDIVTTTPKPSEIKKDYVRKLACVAGDIDHAEITTGYQYFHANIEDYVESQFDTRSGTSTTQPTVVGEQAGVYVGSSVGGFASTVGWV